MARKIPDYMWVVPDLPPELAAGTPPATSTSSSIKTTEAGSVVNEVASSSKSRFPDPAAVADAAREPRTLREGLERMRDLFIAENTAHLKPDVMASRKAFVKAAKKHNLSVTKAMGKDVPHEVFEAKTRWVSAKKTLETETKALEKMFGASEHGKQLQQYIEQDIRQGAMNISGKWTQMLGNVKTNLFTAEHGGGKLAVNWFFTGLGGLMLYDGVKLLTAKPPEVIKEQPTGEMSVEKGHKPFSQIAWGIGELGLGAFNLYWSALSDQRGRSIF